MKDIPIFVQGMVWDITAIHTAYPSFLNNQVKKAIFHQDSNPFLSPVFKQLGSAKERNQVMEKEGPCIILATSGMLSGGASVEFFKEMADNPKNMLIFVSYQGVGSLGRRIQQGEKEIIFQISRLILVPLAVLLTLKYSLSNEKILFYIILMLILSYLFTALFMFFVSIKKMFCVKDDLSIF